jgi:hypothetical protein
MPRTLCFEETARNILSPLSICDTDNVARGEVLACAGAKNVLTWVALFDVV